MEAQKQRNEIGTIYRSKSGVLYIKFNTDIEVKEGYIAFLNDPRKNSKRTPEQIAKIPESVRFNISRPQAPKPKV